MGVQRRTTGSAESRTSAQAMNRSVAGLGSRCRCLSIVSAVALGVTGHWRRGQGRDRGLPPVFEHVIEVGCESLEELEACGGAGSEIVGHADPGPVNGGTAEHLDEASGAVAGDPCVSD